MVIGHTASKGNHHNIKTIGKSIYPVAEFYIKVKDGITSPSQVRTFPKGHVDLINIGGATVGKGIFEPGWRWSESVKPIAKTDSCEAPHFQYQISGTMMVLMDDGTEFECKAGDVSLLPPGHDAWVVGNEPLMR